MLFRFILVNVFSFIKRFFAFNATLYKSVVFIPLFTVLTPRLSKSSIVFTIIFSILLLAMGNIIYYGQFIMYFLLLIGIPMFKRVSFEDLLTKAFPFFIVACLYGLSQKFFGYTFVEKTWISSGLSFADEREFLTDDIRPFSTFASMPEFTFFIAIYLYFFAIQKKYVLLIFALIMLYIAGSRGVFVSTMVACFFTFIVKRYTRRYLFLSFLASLSLFLALVFVFPLILGSADPSSRMLAYGTFNGRIVLLTSVLEQSTIMSLFTGLNLTALEQNTFDNLYFMLVAHFGIFGALYFLFFFMKPRMDKKNFYFFTIFLGYGMYADVVFSYYLMFLFFFAIYSYSNLLSNANTYLACNLPADTNTRII